MSAAAEAAALKSRMVEAAQHLEELDKGALLLSQQPPGSAAARAVGPADSCDVELHLIRHGQAYHNLLGDLYREFGIEFDATGKTGRERSPYARPEVLDCPLTELGREQARALRPAAAKAAPQLVVVSPLRRAAETAMLAFSESKVAQVFHEDVREETGAHTCDRRRDTEEVARDFPAVDASTLAPKDPVWTEDRETKAAVAERGRRFMAWLKGRSEKSIAVASHSAFLFVLTNSVIDCSVDDKLSLWWATGELRTLRIAW
eukprot:TRINITY_DN60510_c0_g1_i1.p1 TRINITY_DN60510_c0_g1~~TRINITY_DN60510_c0_g1_i1.p1  ORF type:complete len:288 (+),score=125.51 TRINITY_DN60510_c0_g1_i1:82-864(+)